MLRLLVSQMVDVMPVKLLGLVRETGLGMVGQNIGQEPRPRARRVEGRPASRLPEPIRARDGEEGGAGRGRGDRPPPASAAGSDRAYKLFRRGTLRAVAGGSRLIRCETKTSGRKL